MCTPTNDLWLRNINPKFNDRTQDVTQRSMKQVMFVKLSFEESLCEMEDQSDIVKCIILKWQLAGHMKWSIDEQWTEKGSKLEL